MNVFTANQVNQIYVVNKAVADSKSLLNKGDATIGEVKDAGGNTVEQIYVKQVGAGGIVRSDLVNLNQIKYINYTPAAKMARHAARKMVVLSDEAMDGDYVKKGDYVLNMVFENALSLSPDNAYIKFAAVHANEKALKASDFYKKLALSIANNLSRDPEPIAAAYLATALTGATVTPVKANNKEADFTGTYVGVIVEEVEQPWIIGIKQQRPLEFRLEPNTLDTYDGFYNWGTVVKPGEKVGTSTLAESAIVWQNGKLMADYEYFYMGERADQYRMWNWPKYTPTEYLVDPSKKYDVISIHYAYQGSNHAVQLSEKDLSLIVLSDATGADLGAQAKALKASIEKYTNPTTTTTTGGSTTGGK